MPGSTGGSWKRSDWSGSPKWDNPTGNRGHQGFWTYRQNHATAPVPDPTHLPAAPLTRTREGLSRNLCGALVGVGTGAGLAAHADQSDGVQRWARSTDPSQHRRMEGSILKAKSPGGTLVVQLFPLNTLPVPTVGTARSRSLSRRTF